jgi:methoxymalonate biosynthesis acyl carrier protein
MDSSQVNNKKTRIKTFLLRYIRNYALEDDSDIFGGGLVNSLFAMQLITFLEKEFAITIENRDLKLDNFRTVNAMADLIERKS